MEVHNYTSALVLPLVIAFSHKRSVFFDTFIASIPDTSRHFSPFPHPANLSFSPGFYSCPTISAKSRVSCKLCMVQS